MTIMRDHRTYYDGGKLDVRAAADFLGVEKHWLDQGRSKGFGPPFLKLSNGTIRYLLEDLRDFLISKRHDPEHAGAGGLNRDASGRINASTHFGDAPIGDGEE
ncbi:MAG: hypothetical protein KDJ29_03765 [Hyphomicrobiales bacterium]|nr:hypothetical protein [Hyphomicrobiales bacterium]